MSQETELSELNELLEYKDLRIKRQTELICELKEDLKRQEEKTEEIKREREEILIYNQEREKKFINIIKYLYNFCPLKDIESILSLLKRFDIYIQEEELR
ncbi:MAG: hypothetical protein AB1567_00850 [bacterium]